MTKNKLYTVVLDFKGGTYIGQAAADSIVTALSRWLSKIEDEELVRWKITRDELSDIVKSEEPVPLDDCINVWCLSGNAKGGLALINVIATDQSV